MKLILASQNKNKIAEIRAKLPQFTISGLDPTQFPNELLETGSTLEENALQKARQVFAITGCSCFADDTGLEVEALDGEPGVLSARYAGERRNSNDNMNLVLERLKNQPNRKARFKTVIALILNGKEYVFEGVCGGEITEQKSGDEGFGYDPIFLPEGRKETFAEMSMKEKGEISHRGRAVNKLVLFLGNYS
ncbi:MAG: RdgB/HAM1 family non-canonical purine NTP pyrophosphatase [Bacteroidia bacterium]|nr:RdgB/HAM1 family non-canonical purine NTP pyrophosphatase [Bacteroidia bacterium]